MSLLVKSEAVTLLSALEATLGTQPTTGWRQHQPNDVQDFQAQIKKVARAPLSKNRQNEKGDIVDLDAAPKVMHDLNKDVIDAFGEGIFLAKTKHTGGTGLAYFTPTSVTSTVYTVAALGTLPQNTLIFARGFTVAGNNGLKVVGAASTGTTIPAAGLAAETVSGYLATVEVAGWRGASGDIGIDINGNLTSTVADFTTMGLVPGMVIWVGGTIGSAFAFGTTAYRGFAQIVTVAAHLMTLKYRQWTIGAADTGVGKTIDLYWGRWLRTVAIDSTDYQEPSYQLELSLPGAAAAGATAYKYAQGNLIDTFEVNAPLANKIDTTITFNGTTFVAPSTTRATGAATPNLPLAQAAFNTTSELLRKPGIYDPGNAEAVVCQDFSSWKINYQNNVTPQKQQGSLGGVRMIVGKAIVAVDLEAFYVQTDLELAIADNRTLDFSVGLRNGDGGVHFDVPGFMASGGAIKLAANGPVTISAKAEGFRDNTYNYTLGMNIFPFLPAA